MPNVIQTPNPKLFPTPTLPTEGGFRELSPGPRGFLRRGAGSGVTQGVQSFSLSRPVFSSISPAPPDALQSCHENNE